MTETFRLVDKLIVRITRTPKRANRIDIWRGGTWNARPIRSEWRNGDERGPAGIFIDERFLALATITQSPEAADPLAR